MGLGLIDGSTTAQAPAPKGEKEETSTNLIGEERKGNIFDFNHQGSTVEVTVAQQLNQGACTHVLYYQACLNFLVLFLSREKVREKVQKQYSAFRRRMSL